MKIKKQKDQKSIQRQRSRLIKLLLIRLNSPTNALAYNILRERE
jgi:hypothetical protein